jgi:high-affinity nickel-transport protein
MTPLAVLGLGFVLGMRHATDVDHVAAVTAMGSRERTLRGALSLGTLWGVGHTLNLSSAPAGHAHPHRLPLARPLLVGVVHGLAGSAAVALLVLTTIRDPFWALSYLVIFGLGTILGMALLTASIVMPLAAAAKRFESADRYLVRTLGLVSIAVGIALAYRVGFVDGLFLTEPLAAK